MLKFLFHIVLVSVLFTANANSSFAGARPYDPFANPVDEPCSSPNASSIRASVRPHDPFAKPYDPFARPVYETYSFRDSCDNQVGSFLGLGRKDWSQNERDLVTFALNRVFRRHPYRLPDGGPESVELFRVVTSEEGLVAYCHGSQIIIPDSFFRSCSPLQFDLVLIHELVHVKDAGARFSLSSRWCKLMCPRIAKFHSLWKKGSDHLAKGSSEADIIAAKCGLPDGYAAKNPEEAFAEFGTAVLSGRSVDPDVKTFVEQAVMGKDGSDRPGEKPRSRYFQQVAQATNSLGAYRFSDAEKQLYQLLREAENVEVHTLLSCLHRNSGQYDRALYHAERRIILLQELGVPLECSTRKEARKQADYCAHMVPLIFSADTCISGTASTPPTVVSR